LFNKSLKPKPKQNSPVSIVICSRNEEKNLVLNLPSICKQNYSEFEVIIVDDHSDDESISIIKHLQQEFKHLKLVFATDYGLKGKRNALLTGVKHAKYDHLLFTDADCRPASTNWIFKMTEPLEGGADIVAGISPIRKDSVFLNKWARWDNFNVYWQYSSFIAYGLAYMATGRNIAMKRSTLFRTIQNPKYNSTLTGDDDLLVNSYNNSSKISMVNHPASFTFTNYPSTCKAWFNQKSRHVGSARYYRLLPGFLLALFQFSWLIVYIFLILLLIFGVNTKLVLLIFVGRLLFLSTVLSRPLSRTKNQDLIKWIPLFDGITVIINLILIPFLWFDKKKKWR